MLQWYNETIKQNMLESTDEITEDKLALLGEDRLTFECILGKKLFTEHRYSEARTCLLHARRHIKELPDEVDDIAEFFNKYYVACLHIICKLP